MILVALLLNIITLQPSFRLVISPKVAWLQFSATTMNQSLSHFGWLYLWSLTDDCRQLSAGWTRHSLYRWLHFGPPSGRYSRAPAQARARQATRPWWPNWPGRVFQELYIEKPHWKGRFLMIRHVFFSMWDLICICNILCTQNRCFKVYGCSIIVVINCCHQCSSIIGAHCSIIPVFWQTKSGKLSSLENLLLSRKSSTTQHIACGASLTTVMKIECHTSVTSHTPSRT